MIYLYLNEINISHFLYIKRKTKNSIYINHSAVQGEQNNMTGKVGDIIISSETKD